MEYKQYNTYEILIIGDNGDGKRRFMELLNTIAIKPWYGNISAVNTDNGLIRFIITDGSIICNDEVGAYSSQHGVICLYDIWPQVGIENIRKWTQWIPQSVPIVFCGSKATELCVENGIKIRNVWEGPIPYCDQAVIDYGVVTKVLSALFSYLCNGHIVVKSPILTLGAYNKINVDNHLIIKTNSSVLWPQNNKEVAEYLPILRPTRTNISENNVSETVISNLSPQQKSGRGDVCDNLQPELKEKKEFKVFRLIFVCQNNIDNHAYLRLLRNDLSSENNTGQPYSIVFDSNYGKILFSVLCEPYYNGRDGDAVDGLLFTGELSRGEEQFLVRCGKPSFFCDTREPEPEKPFLKLAKTLTGKYDLRFVNKYEEQIAELTKELELSKKLNADISSNTKVELTPKEDKKVTQPDSEKDTLERNLAATISSINIDEPKQIYWMGTTGGMVKITCEFYKDGEIVKQNS